jgi:outer membrane murein-binding lipoprotein Lpp
MNRAAAVACFAAVLLSGCANRSAVRQVADDLQAVHTEVEFPESPSADQARAILARRAPTR